MPPPQVPTHVDAHALVAELVEPGGDCAGSQGGAVELEPALDLRLLLGRQDVDDPVAQHPELQLVEQRQGPSDGPTARSRRSSGDLLEVEVA